MRPRSQPITPRHCCRWLLLLLTATVPVTLGTTKGIGTESIITSSNHRRGLRQDVLLDTNGETQFFEKNSNMTNPYRLMSKEAIEKERRERKKRMRERRERARELLKNAPPPRQEHLTKMSQEEVDKLQAEASDRKLNWFSSGSTTYATSFMADPSQDYDKWAQAYRMLGGMIDCDHDKDEGSHHSGDNYNNYNEDQGACSRWMLWAAYVNPDYQGNEYDEYFGDEPTSSLDCHSTDSNWQLLGVYRQEFYQFIEQISKHLWAIDEYEYVVALAGLAYMTDYDCFQVGQTNSGNAIYAGVAPQPYGYFEMALYTDQYCLTPDTSLGMTYDDFGLQSDIDLGSKDNTDDDSYSWAYDWWYDTQEYTLTNLNAVYDEYKYCTSCVDYPTYQDGYFIGDYGTDDDDLINQCWKFYSHDSYTCEADCIAKAHAQGTILTIEYGETTFGKSSSSFYKERDSSTGEIVSSESPFQRLMANAALTASFLLFVATFLAFAVARRSRYRESRSSKSRRLLDDEDGDGRSRRSRKSSKHADGDGLFRTSHHGSSSRSKSMSRKHGSSSRSKSRSASKSGDRSSRKHSKRSRSYEPPKEEGRARSKSATRTEDF